MIVEGGQVGGGTRIFCLDDNAVGIVYNAGETPIAASGKCNAR
jgi:hypothetical protein